MKKALIGKKVGMTQIFDADGKVIPVTVIEAGPCVVTQVKTAEQARGRPSEGCERPEEVPEGVPPGRLLRIRSRRRDQG